MTMIPVKMIEMETTDKTIIVKVLKVWFPTDKQKRPVSMEAILMDAEGTQIPVYVKRGLIANFKKQLAEGKTIQITNFGVDENSAHKWQKAQIQCPVKLLLNYVTKVSVCKPDLCITSSGLNLIKFDDIPEFKEGFYIDVIGRLIKVGSFFFVEKANARKIDIGIQDERNAILKVVLWEAYAEKLLEVVSNNEKVEDDCITIILEFAMKSIWMKELRVQTAVHATKLMINEDLPKTEDFNLKKIKVGKSLPSHYITIKNKSRDLTPEEWLNMETHRTTMQIKNSNEVGIYIVFVNLKDVAGETWYYNTCGSCNTTCKDAKIGDMCTSSNCAIKIESMIPKFRVKFNTSREGDSENIQLVIFEDVMTGLIGKSASMVHESLIKDGEPEAFPWDFADILGKDYLVKLRLTREYNIIKGSNEFTVDCITSDESILTEYFNKTDNVVGSDFENEKVKSNGEENEGESQDSNDGSIATSTKRNFGDLDEEKDGHGLIRKTSTKEGAKKTRK